MKIDVNHPKTIIFHSLAKKVDNAYEFFELVKKLGYDSESNKQKGDPTEGFAYVHFCLNGEFSKVDYCPEGERGFDLDLIREGKKEACQAKFRTSETITSDELATTGDQAWHKGHSGIYVFGNLHELPPLWKSNKKACLIGLTELDNIDWQEYVNASAGIVKPLVPKTLRGEQPRIYQEICDFKLDRGVVYVPAGGGKTFLETLTFINKWDKKNPILVCAPFIRLVNQHYREITKECRARGISFKSIVVNSGGKIGRDENDTDMTQEGQEGVIATTDPKEIVRFLKKGRKTLRIVFCTYASIDVLARASKAFKFSVGIMDEAHNLTGHVSKAWTRIHSNKFINIKNRYYFTATGKSYSGDRDDIFGMPVRNRPEFKSKAFGPIISYTSIRQAINAKMINDYRIILPHISSKKLAQYWAQLKENVFLDVPNDENGNLNLTMQEVFMKTVIYKAFELKTDIIRFIGLFNRVDNAKRMAQFLKQEDVITKEFGFVLNNVDWVAGQGKKNKREFDTAIRNFSNSSERSFLCATQVLNEGIDIKGRNDERANAVIFCDPKRTKFGIQQGSGRGMRFDPNSKTGLSYIVLPLLEGEKEDGDFGVIYNIAMDSALDVVKSMRVDDEQLHDEMRNFTIGRRMSKGSYKKTSGILEIPDIVKESFDSEGFVDAIELRIIDPSYNSYLQTNLGGLNFPAEFYYDCASQKVSQKTLSKLTGFFHGQLSNDCIKKTGKSYVELVTGKKKKFTFVASHQEKYKNIRSDIIDDVSANEICKKYGINGGTLSKLISDNGDVSYRQMISNQMLFEYSMAIEYGLSEQINCTELLRLFPRIKHNFATRCKKIYGRDYSTMFGSKSGKSFIPMLETAMIVEYAKINPPDMLKNLKKMFKPSNLAGNAKKYYNCTLNEAIFGWTRSKNAS